MAPTATTVATYAAIPAFDGRAPAGMQVFEPATVRWNRNQVDEIPHTSAAGSRVR